MKLRVLLAAAAVTAAAFAAPVRAQEKSAAKASGFYATLGAGASWTGNTGNRAKSYSGQYNSSESYSGEATPIIDLGAGFSGEAGLGYDFGNFRTELTYVFKAADIGEITGSGTESGTYLGVPYSNLGYSFTASGNGSVNTSSVFVSGYYDVSTNSKVTPYVGGGLGYTRVSIPAQNGTAQLTSSGEVFSVPLDIKDGSAAVFGYQAKLGLAYAASNEADLFVEATYQGSPAITIKETEFSGLNAFGARAGVRIRFGS